MAPVSGTLWEAKGLDDEANIEEALAILQSVIDVFDYWRKPEIQGQLRDVFNKVYLELDIFKDASNALRSTKGEPVPSWSISRLWQEYVQFDSPFAHMDLVLLNMLQSTSPFHGATSPGVDVPTSESPPYDLDHSPSRSAQYVP
jgi:hypothetical protein